MRMPGVSKEAKAVYALLCSYTGDKDYCFPTVETLAADLETSERQIIRLTEELKLKGLVEKRKLDGNKRKTTYIPLVPESLIDVTSVTNCKKDAADVTRAKEIGDTGDIITGDTHGTLILTSNTNTQENINTQDAREAHPFDQKVQGIPKPIAEKLEKYRKHVQDFGPLGRLMMPVDAAVCLVGPQIVHDAIAQIIDEAQTVEPRFRVTNIVKLLGDEQRLRERAAKYKLIQTSTGPPNDEAVIRSVALKLKHGREVPEEIRKWIPQAQELNARAG